MKDVVFTIKEQNNLAPNVYELKLQGDTSDITRPGQFVNIKIDGFYLRRPISVCDYSYVAEYRNVYDNNRMMTDNNLHAGRTDEVSSAGTIERAAGSNTSDDMTSGIAGNLTLIYKVVGHGTEVLSGMMPSSRLQILTGLGNGYDTSLSGEAPLLLGGGAGVPPMYKLAKVLRGEGKDVHVVLGFNTASEVFYEDEFKALGCHVSVTTVDGSYGVKGFVTDALPENYTYFYTCGPGPMLKAIYRASATSGQFSFEERMGCGFGACMGCTCKTITGYKRICKDGPVLMKEEILWDA